MGHIDKLNHQLAQSDVAVLFLLDIQLLFDESDNFIHFLYSYQKQNANELHIRGFSLILKEVYVKHVERNERNHIDRQLIARKILLKYLQSTCYVVALFNLGSVQIHKNIGYQKEELNLVNKIQLNLVNIRLNLLKVQDH